MTLSGLDWRVVFAAVAINMILGFLWYGPIFGKPWLKLIGKKKDKLPQNFTMYAVPVLSTLLSVIVLWTIMRATGLSGIITAITAWIGFVALTTYTNDLFEGRLMKLWLINNGYHLVGFIISGLLLDLLA